MIRHYVGGQLAVLVVWTSGPLVAEGEEYLAKCPSKGQQSGYRWHRIETTVPIELGGLRQVVQSVA